MTSHGPTTRKLALAFFWVLLLASEMFVLCSKTFSSFMGSDEYRRLWDAYLAFYFQHDSLHGCIYAISLIYVWSFPLIFCRQAKTSRLLIVQSAACIFAAYIAEHLSNRFNDLVVCPHFE